MLSTSEPSLISRFKQLINRQGKPGGLGSPTQVSNRPVKPSAKGISVGVMTPLTPSVLVDQREGEVSDKPEKPAAHSAPGGYTAVAAPGVNWDLKRDWGETC